MCETMADMDPMILTVAGVGAELTLEDQPRLPVTPEALARDAEECRAAGASIYHLHVRDPAGAPAMSVDVYRAGREAIESASDLIVQFSTGGAVTDQEEDRIAPLSLAPEMATLTTGTVNFGDSVFFNPPGLLRRFYDRMLGQGVLPEFEIFEPGMIANAARLMEEAGARHHMHFDFVLGVPGAMPAWQDSTAFLSSHLPTEATWTATGIGRSAPTVWEAAASLGGHIRTGFEDVLYVAKGQKASSNAELISRAVHTARAAGRAIADPDEARALLGISGSYR
jgi:3-keto-5-aminohexanoate cleavage enzyme